MRERDALGLARPAETLNGSVALEAGRPEAAPIADPTRAVDLGPVPGRERLLHGHRYRQEVQDSAFDTDRVRPAISAVPLALTPIQKL